MPFALAENYWLLYLLYLLLTIAVETPILLLGLSRRHKIPVRLFAGVWLNACSYPIVFIVFPALIHGQPTCIIISEIFAPLFECLLFWYAIGRHAPPSRAAAVRDYTVIVLANLASFGVGEIMRWDSGLPW